MRRSARCARSMAHNSAAARDDQACAIGMQGRGERMNGRAVGELAGFAAVERALEQLGVAGAVGSEEHLRDRRERTSFAESRSDD